MPKRISASGAVTKLADWIQTNGRNPQTQEFLNENGLPHYTTYYKKFGSIPAALSAAHSYLCGVSGALSAYILNRRPPQPCLGCGTTIAWKGPAVRHCRRCRKRLFAANDVEPEGALPLHIYRDQWTSDIETMVDWGEGVTI